jgi:hypothetical protein
LKGRGVSEFVAAPLVLAALFLAAFGRFLTGDRSLATFQDNTYFYLPLFRHVSDAFGRGEYPYWINTLMGGIPLYDNPNFSLTYPLYFFQWGLYTDAVSAITQLHYVVFLHLFITYLNFYVLLRVLRLPPLPALVGASVFAFSQNTFSYATWVARAATYCWVPLALAGAVLFLENRRARLGVWLTTLSLTLLILASPANALIHAVYLLGVLFIFKAASRLRRGERRELLSAAKNFAKAGLFTAVLGSPVLVPVLYHTGDMIRFASYDPPAVGFSRLTYHATLYGQLEVAHLAGALLPYEVPATIGHPYVGLCVVTFALLALFRARASWVVAPLVFVAAYGLLSATGSHLGLARVNYLLPLLNKFREPDHHLFLFVLGASALAAFGFDYFTEVVAGRGAPPLGRKHLYFIPLLLALALAALGVNLPYAGSVPRWLLLASPAAALLLMSASRLVGGRARAVPACLAAALIVLTSLALPKKVPELREGDFFSPQNLASRRALEELSQLEDVRRYRVIFAEPELGEQRWALNASYYGLRSFYATSSVLPYRQFLEVYLPQFKPSRYSLMLGAKYYLCGRCEGAPLPDYSYLKDVGGYKLFAADTALPRYALVGRVAGVYESWQDLYDKVNRGGDYTGGVYLAPADAARVGEWLGEPSAPQARIAEEESTLNVLRLRVETDRRAVLVFNEYNGGAWKAAVDGARTRPLRVNWNQLGVLVEKGTSVVEFEYRPTFYVLLLWVQRVAFFALALYASFQSYRSASEWRARGRMKPLTSDGDSALS